MHEWYLQNARAKFSAIAVTLIAQFKRHKVEPTNIVLREMATRWGTCTPKGKIILNPELIKAPQKVVLSMSSFTNFATSYITTIPKVYRPANEGDA